MLFWGGDFLWNLIEVRPYWGKDLIEWTTDYRVCTVFAYKTSLKADSVGGGEVEPFPSLILFLFFWWLLFSPPSLLLFCEKKTSLQKFLITNFPFLMSAAFFSQKGKREREKGLWPVSHVKVNKFYVRTAYLFWGGDFLWRGALREKKKNNKFITTFSKGKHLVAERKALSVKRPLISGRSLWRRPGLPGSWRRRDGTLHNKKYLREQKNILRGNAREERWKVAWVGHVKFANCKTSVH